MGSEEKKEGEMRGERRRGKQEKKASKEIAPRAGKEKRYLARKGRQDQVREGNGRGRGREIKE